MPLPDAVADPVPLAILTLAIAAVVHYQRGLTWAEYRQIHRAKVRLFPTLARPSVPVSLVNSKGDRSDAEYLVTRKQSVSAVWKQLVAEGGSPHLVCSIKRRPPGEYSAAHVVWIHADGSQTESYLFANGDGTTDVYTHYETAVTDADGHLSDPQTDGDPRGVVRDALGMVGGPDDA